MNRSGIKAVLAGIALLGASAIPGIVTAEEPPADGVTTGTAATAGEDSATAWDNTKEVSADAWEATRSGSARAWDKTKEVSADAWEATREGSARAWNKTKEISADAWEATREGTANAWDNTSGMVQGEPQTAPGPETADGQVSRATPAPSP